MSNLNRETPEFGGSKPGTPGGSPSCAECEAMLADALDGTLTADEQQRFDAHMLSCAECSEMLADAQRGAAWLELLRDPRPEPPALLVERILQRTQTEATQGIALVQPAAVGGTTYLMAPAAVTSNLYPFPTRGKSLLRSLHHTLLQPRLAMTAAMAFFSIGLTLNLTGVQLNQLNTKELKPSNLRQTFYQANAHIIRYYDNLRVVYELESRVRELQRTNDNGTPASDTPAPATKSPQQEPQQKRPTPRSGSGSSRQQLRIEPRSLAALVVSARIQKGVPA